MTETTHLPTCSPRRRHRWPSPRQGGAQPRPAYFAGCQSQEPSRCVKCITCITQIHQKHVPRNGLTSKTVLLTKPLHMHKPCISGEKAASHRRATSARPSYPCCRSSPAQGLLTKFECPSAGSGHY